MTTNIQDDKFAVVDEHIDDGIYALLGIDKSITDDWNTWLIGQGYSGKFADMMKQFLLDNGYADEHLDDMLKKWWENGAPILTSPATYTADTTTIFADTTTVFADAY